jgi:hypothetical protein
MHGGCLFGIGMHELVEVYVWRVQGVESWGVMMKSYVYPRGIWVDGTMKRQKNDGLDEGLS